MSDFQYYTYAQFDPRSTEEASAHNEQIFADAGERGVWGIEVTIPSLAALCERNIDPQHSGGSSSVTAIELAALFYEPPAGITFATVRPDLDSVGAMAMFEVGHETGGIPTTETVSRVKIVADADKFAKGDWPGPRPLPTVENSYPEGGSAFQLAAIGAAVADFKVPLDERVGMMKHWLLTGEDPPGYRERAENERADLVAALEMGAICITTPGNSIAAVRSTHRAATMLGYLRAPVVVALNPEFRLGGGEPHWKFTVCAYSPKYADINGVLQDLVAREPGWGGSSTIIGSPQGVSSSLTIKEIVSVVEEHLL
ncbi:MAG: hypothetical protein OXB96_00840 [Candidatus Kaiserbacteria bacterium]|nr:hypothetical protein [Candidatus Kaiserbacteria bacterium]